MDISQCLEVPHLSASAISQYMDCGLAYKFAKVDRLEPEFMPDTMLFGIIIHRTLENYYTHRKAGNSVKLHDVLECFEALWNTQVNNTDKIQFSPDKDPHSYLIEGKELLSVWYDKHPENDFKVIGVEEGFVFHVPEIDIPVIGYIDLLEQDESGAIIVTDFKTTARAFGRDEIDKNMQMLIYQMFMEAAGYGDREILLRLDCLIKTRTPKFESYYTTRTKDDEQRIIRKTQTVWDGIQKEVYLPNDTGWKCKGCRYRKACNDWFKGGSLK